MKFLVLALIVLHQLALAKSEWWWDDENTDTERLLRKRSATTHDPQQHSVVSHAHAIAAADEQQPRPAILLNLAPQYPQPAVAAAPVHTLHTLPELVNFEVQRQPAAVIAAQTLVQEPTVSAAPTPAVAHVVPVLAPVAAAPAPQPAAGPLSVVSELHKRMETKLYSAVDTVNTLIDRTNQSLNSYFTDKQRHLQETYAKLAADLAQESLASQTMMRALIANSTEIIANMQAYFEHVMGSTVEAAYNEMSAMLASAIGRIQTICAEIGKSFAANTPGTTTSQQEENLAAHEYALSNAMRHGLDSMASLASKYKNEMLNIKPPAFVFNVPLNTLPPAHQNQAATLEETIKVLKFPKEKTTWRGGNNEMAKKLRAADIQEEREVLERAHQKTIELAKKLVNFKRDEAGASNKRQRVPLHKKKTTARTRSNEAVPPSPQLLRYSQVKRD